MPCISSGHDCSHHVQAGPGARQGEHRGLQLPQVRTNCSGPALLTAAVCCAGVQSASPAETAPAASRSVKPLHRAKWSTIRLPRYQPLCPKIILVRWLFRQQFAKLQYSVFLLGEMTVWKYLVCAELLSRGDKPSFIFFQRCSNFRCAARAGSHIRPSG